MHLISHIGSAVVVTATIAPFINVTKRHNIFKLILLASVGVAAPDIDAISVLFNHSIFYSNYWYSHHGALHSLFGVLPVTLLFAFFAVVLERKSTQYSSYKTLIFYFSVIYSGNVLHIIEDLPAPPGPWNGLMLFWPFSSGRYGGWSHFWWQNEYLEVLFFLSATYSLVMLVLSNGLKRYKQPLCYLLVGCNTVVLVLAVKFSVASRYIEPSQWERYQIELLDRPVYDAVNSLNSLYSQIWTTQIF
jgi:hypothetical protein